MKQTHVFLLMVLILFVGCVAEPQSEKKSSFQFPKDPRARMAMMDCMDTILKDEKGRSNKEEIRVCMKERGFIALESKKKLEGDNF